LQFYVSDLKHAAILEKAKVNYNKNSQNNACSAKGTHHDKYLKLHYNKFLRKNHSAVFWRGKIYNKIK
jgi:hypothetical protein